MADIALGTTKTNYGTDVASLTIADVVCSGTDRAIIITIQVFDDTSLAERTVASVVRDGVSATRIARKDLGNIASELWIMIAPTVGTANVVITGGGNNNFIVGSATPLTGVDQTNPVNTSADTTTDGTNINTTVTPTANGCLVIDSVIKYNTTEALTLFAGTTLHNIAVGSGYGIIGASSYQYPIASGETATAKWTWTPTSRDSALMVAAIKPSETISEYTITIGGVNRTDDVVASSITIEDVINDKANTCKFILFDRGGDGTPATDDEVIITMSDGTRLFGGYITNVSMSKQGTGGASISINCVDYTYILDRNLAHISYEDQTDAEIITELVGRYCSGLGVTTVNVVEGVTITSIKFNYVQLSQALRKIAELTGRNWYIDYSKDIHYFPLTTNAAPFNIDSTTNTYSNLQISKDTSQLKNRVYVRGGTKLSDPTTYSVKGDGVARQFPLPDKPHDVTLTVNGSTKTVGIKNVDTSGYDWYLNFQEKYVEQDSGGSVLGTGDTLAVTYTYDIPILVAVEDTDSILANGVKEFAIFDKTISTTQAARDRASAELTDYANDIVEGSFITYEPGFRSGQYININLSDYGINDDYLVQKVVAKSMGAGNYFYQVYIASSKTLGIIKFLIGLLEANKNLIELDEDEVVDELFQLTDNLISDSLTDALTIDSTGPYFTWCTTSGDSSPVTRARWELFQWG